MRPVGQFPQLLCICQTGTLLNQLLLLSQLQIRRLDFAHLILQEIDAARQLPLIPAQGRQFAPHGLELAYQVSHLAAQGPQLTIPIQQIDMLTHAHQR